MDFDRELVAMYAPHLLGLYDRPPAPPSARKWVRTAVVQSARTEQIKELETLHHRQPATD